MNEARAVQQAAEGHEAASSPGWRRPAFLALTTLAFPAALYTTVFLHEALGHGLLAWALGGQFYAFFVNPFGGVAYFSMPELGGWRTALIQAGGILVTLGVGAGLWVLAGRVRGLPARLLLLLIAGANVLNATLYVALDPLVSILTGGQKGDVVLLLSQYGIPAPPVALFGLAVSLWLTKRLCRRFLFVLGSSGLAPRSRRQALELLWTVVGPGLAVYLVGTVAAAWHLTSFSFASSIVQLVVFALFYAVGAGLTVRRWRPRVRQDPPTATRALGLWVTTLVLAVALAGLMVVFGPTDKLARGLLLRAPDSQAFPGWGVRTGLVVSVQPDLVADASGIVRSVPPRGSPLERALASAVNEAGPDESAILVGRVWLWWRLPGVRFLEDLPLQRAGEGWAIGSRVDLKGSQVLEELPGRGWRLRLEVPADAEGQLERVEVRLADGLQALASEGFQGSQGVLWWEPQAVPADTAYLTVDFARRE